MKPVQFESRGFRSNSGNVDELSESDSATSSCETTWSSLDSDKRKHLLSKKLIVLQGDAERKVELKTILGMENTTEEQLQKLNNFIDPQILRKLENNVKIHVGECVPGLGEIEAYFIPTSLYEEKSKNAYYSVKKPSEFLKNMKPREMFIIADEPGSGKSTMLKTLGQEMKMMFPNCWVVFVDLGRYRNVFEKRLDLKIESSSAAVDFFVDEMYSSRNDDQDFEKKLLKRRMKETGNVRLLFDAYDEVRPKCEDFMNHLLRELKNSCIDNLIVTMRFSYFYLQKINRKLCASLYRMNTLDLEYAMNLIANYWTRKTGRDELWLKSKAKDMRELFSPSEGDYRYRSSFLESPLYCVLLAKVYQNKLTSWEKWKPVSLYEMYRQYASLQLDEVEADMNGVVTKLRVNEYHWESSFRLIFGDEIVKKAKFRRLPIEDERSLRLKVLRVGLMTETGECPVFIHRTFAEFFVAQFFLERIQHLKEDDFWDAGQLLMENILGWVLENDEDDDWRSSMYYCENESIKLIKEFFENGLKSLTIEENKFRLIRKSIQKAWRVDARSTFTVFRRAFANVAKRYETFQFLLKCFIVDGTIPTDFYNIVANAVQPYYIESFCDRPRPTECRPDVKIFLKSLSSCPKNVQEIIMTQRHHCSGVIWDCVMEMAAEFPDVLVTHESLRAKQKKLLEFHQAAEVGNVERLRDLLSETQDYETRYWLLNASIQDFHGCTTASTKAIAKNQATALEFLLANGATVDPPMHQYYSPLLFGAIGAKSLKCLEILLKRKADVELKHRDERPLEYACRLDLTEMVSCLLDHGCDKDNTEALFHAIYNGSTKMVELLLKRGLDANSRGKENQTPLQYAVQHVKRCKPELDKPSIIILLLRHGADPEAKDEEGRTVLLITTMEGEELPALNILLHGANKEARDKEGNTALHLAAKHDVRLRR